LQFHYQKVGGALANLFKICVCICGFAYDILMIEEFSSFMVCLLVVIKQYYKKLDFSLYLEFNFGVEGFGI